MLTRRIRLISLIVVAFAAAACLSGTEEAKKLRDAFRKHSMGQIPDAELRAALFRLVDVTPATRL